MKINIYKLFKLLIADYKNVIKYLSISLVIGLIIVFSIPSKYKTEVKMAPETTDNGFSGSISSLASMVGLGSLGGSLGDDAIYPEIYPELFKSVTFLSSLLNITFTDPKSNAQETYYEYLSSHQKSAWWSLPLKWIFAQHKDEGSSIDPFKLNKSQSASVALIRKNVKCTVDKKTSIITLDVTAQDPVISAILADSITNRLQDFITDYRTNKARRDLIYAQQLADEAKSKYAKARKAYSEFSDANQNLKLSEYKVKLDELQNEVDMTSSVYTQLCQQVQLAQAKVLEHTPAFTYIQGASVPLRKANLPKSISLILFLFCGFSVRIAVLVYKHKEDLE